MDKTNEEDLEELDAGKVQQAVIVITEAFEKHDVGKVYAVCAMRILLELLAEEGLKVELTKTPIDKDYH